MARLYLKYDNIGGKITVNRQYKIRCKQCNRNIPQLIAKKFVARANQKIKNVAKAYDWSKDKMTCIFCIRAKRSRSRGAARDYFDKRNEIAKRTAIDGKVLGKNLKMYDD